MCKYTRMFCSVQFVFLIFTVASKELVFIPTGCVRKHEIWINKYIFYDFSVITQDCMLKCPTFVTIASEAHI